MKPMVAICCFCERIRGDLGPEGGAGLWHEPHLYLARHSLYAEDFQVSQTYCPSCLTKYHQYVSSDRPATGISLDVIEPAVCLACGRRRCRSRHRHVMTHKQERNVHR